MAFFNKVLRLRQIQYLYANVKKFSLHSRSPVIDKFHSNWKEKFSNILIEHDNISNETWKSMRNYTVEEAGVDKEVADAFILEIFKREKCPDAGINYYKFLETNNYNCSETIVAKYLSLYQVKETLTDAEKAIILNCCNKIIKECELLPGFLVELIAQIFCRFDKWEEVILLLEKFEKHDTGNLVCIYNRLIFYFLNNDKLELALKYFAIAMARTMNIDKSTYIHYLKYCLQKGDEFNQTIEKMFLLWRKYGFKPHKNTIDQYIEVCNEVGWSAQLVTTSNSQCSECHETIEEPQLSDEDFNRLRDVIAKKVITDKMYIVASPGEMQAFMRFMKKNKPYDFVVDGLNVVLGYTNHSAFLKLIKRLKDEGKKILFVGRRHMMKHRLSLQIKDMVDFFFLNNMSKDDPFILYAAFLSGNGTNIISKDLMRQHKFIFHNTELDSLFKKWQIRHQYCMNNETGKLEHLNSSFHIDAFAIKTRDCWHIPYHVFADANLNRRHVDNADWACFKMCP